MPAHGPSCPDQAPSFQSLRERKRAVRSLTAGRRPCPTQLVHVKSIPNPIQSYPFGLVRGGTSNIGTHHLAQRKSLGNEIFRGFGVLAAENPRIQPAKILYYVTFVSFCSLSDVFLLVASSCPVIGLTVRKDSPKLPIFFSLLR